MTYDYIPNNTIPEYVPNDTTTNTTKRCPIVLCLDISPSMSIKNRIENLNKAVGVLLTELEKDSKSKNCAEIAVATFSTEVNDSASFEMTEYWKRLNLTPVSNGITNMSAAVLKSIKKIENRIAFLEQEGIEHYIPFLILVTDGDPCKTDNKVTQEDAIDLVRSHCVNSPLIAPFIIGVGQDAEEELLDRYAERFTRKAIILDDDSQEVHFNQLFAFIGQSIRNSLQGEGDLGHLYERIGKSARKETTRFNEIRKHKRM